MVEGGLLGEGGGVDEEKRSGQGGGKLQGSAYHLVASP